MEEILEQLQDAAQSSAWGLEKPEHDQTVAAEEQILLPFPRDFREFLLETGDLLVGTLEPGVVADASAHNYLPELAANAWDVGVPRHLIPFCQLPGRANSYYCVDPDGEIQLWHGARQSDESWETIWYWARDVWLES